MRGISQRVSLTTDCIRHFSLFVFVCLFVVVMFSGSVQAVVYDQTCDPTTIICIDSSCLGPTPETRICCDSSEQYCTDVPDWPVPDDPEPVCARPTGELVRIVDVPVEGDYIYVGYNMGGKWIRIPGTHNQDQIAETIANAYTTQFVSGNIKASYDKNQNPPEIHFWETYESAGDGFTIKFFVPANMVERNLPETGIQNMFSLPPTYIPADDRYEYSFSVKGQAGDPCCFNDDQCSAPDSNDWCDGDVLKRNVSECNTNNGCEKVPIVIDDCAANVPSQICVVNPSGNDSCQNPETTYEWQGTGNCANTCTPECGPGTCTEDYECVDTSTGNVVADSNCDGSKPTTDMNCQLFCTSPEICDDDSSTCVTPPPTYVDLTIDDTEIDDGQSTTLRWTSNGVTTCTGSGPGFSTGDSTSGDDGVSPSVGTHTYEISCDPGPQTDSVTLTVNSVDGGTYSWDVGNWGTCSEPNCGGGFQTRSVVCRDGSNNAVADSNCPSPKPATSQNCGGSCSSGTCDTSTNPNTCVECVDNDDCPGGACSGNVCFDRPTITFNPESDTTWQQSHTTEVTVNAPAGFNSADYIWTSSSSHSGSYSDSMTSNPQDITISSGSGWRYLHVLAEDTIGQTRRASSGMFASTPYCTFPRLALNVLMDRTEYSSLNFKHVS